MNRGTILITAACAAVAGCAGSPEVPTPSAAPVFSPAPYAATAGASAQSSHSLAAALEERHHALAQASINDGNWADALVHWELLTLLQPQVQRYRDAAAETRARIAQLTANLLPAAQQARKQGHLDQAELLFLRVLKVDRENAAAAQALRDIEADRTKRAYTTRLPRSRM